MPVHHRNGGMLLHEMLLITRLLVLQQNVSWNQLLHCVRMEKLIAAVLALSITLTQAQQLQWCSLITSRQTFTTNCNCDVLSRALIAEPGGSLPNEADFSKYELNTVGTPVLGQFYDNAQLCATVPRS